MNFSLKSKESGHYSSAPLDGAGTVVDKNVFNFPYPGHGTLH